MSVGSQNTCPLDFPETRNQSLKSSRPLLEPRLFSSCAALSQDLHILSWPVVSFAAILQSGDAIVEPPPLGRSRRCYTLHTIFCCRFAAVTLPASHADRSLTSFPAQNSDLQSALTDQRGLRLRAEEEQKKSRKEEEEKGSVPKTNRKPFVRIRSFSSSYFCVYGLDFGVGFGRQSYLRASATSIWSGPIFVRQPRLHQIHQIHQIHSLGHAIRVANVAKILHNEPAVADGASGLVQPELQRRR